MNFVFHSQPSGGQFWLRNYDNVSDRDLKQAHYRMIWNRGPSMQCRIDGYSFELTTEQMAFLTPVHHLDFLQPHGETFVLGFNREFYCIVDNDHEVSCQGALFFGSQNVPLIDISKDEQGSFSGLLTVMLEEFDENDGVQGEMLRALLKRWIIKATRLLRKQNSYADLSLEAHESIRQFTILVEQHFRQRHKVSDYAAMLNKSPKTLSNSFKRYRGASPLEIIQQRILLEAKRLLLYSDLSAKEIGYELGFDDPTNFARFFKRHAGMGTSEFRQSARPARLHRAGNRNTSTGTPSL